MAATAAATINHKRAELDASPVALPTGSDAYESLSLLLTADELDDVEEELLEEEEEELLEEDEDPPLLLPPLLLLLPPLEEPSLDDPPHFLGPMGGQAKSKLNQATSSRLWGTSSPSSTMADDEDSTATTALLFSSLPRRLVVSAVQVAARTRRAARTVVKERMVLKVTLGTKKGRHKDFVPVVVVVLVSDGRIDKIGVVLLFCCALLWW